MKVIKILPSFEKCIKKLSNTDKEKLKKSLHQLNSFIEFGLLPKGLGFKKIKGNIYELRVDIRLRIILQMDEEVIYLVLVGSHDDIKRYLKKIK
jgi:mRNA-degrading endonuclease RelE of RelBE toxin-antitoxin system